MRGPKRVAVVQQKRRGKEGERSVDPLFFVNRLVNIFPELRDELNEEKIVYGPGALRPPSSRAHVVPRCEDFGPEIPRQRPHEEAVLPV